MPEIQSTSVRYFSSDDGVFQLNGTRGSLIKLLDNLCLGYGSKDVVALSVLNGVATCECRTEHNFDIGKVIRIDGAFPAAFNRDWKIAECPTTYIFRFYTGDLLGNITATGSTITAKIAPLYLEKIEPMDDISVGFYRFTSIVGPDAVLHVIDDQQNGDYRYVTIYVTSGESINPIAGPVYFAKSMTVNEAPREWFIITDEQMLYITSMAFSYLNNGVTTQQNLNGIGFGNCISLNSSITSPVLFGCYNKSYNFYGFTRLGFDLHGGMLCDNQYSYNPDTIGTPAIKITWNGEFYVSGIPNIRNIVLPSTIPGVSQVYMFTMEGSNQATAPKQLIGPLPGYWNLLQGTMEYGSTFTAFNRTFKYIGDTASGVAFDLVGPWRDPNSKSIADIPTDLPITQNTIRGIISGGDKSQKYEVNLYDRDTGRLLQKTLSENNTYAFGNIDPSKTYFVCAIDKNDIYNSGSYDRCYIDG